MKTIIEIIIVIVIIVTLNIVASNFFMNELEYYNYMISDIYDAIQENKTDKAFDKIESLTDRWHDTNSIWGALTNHEELEQIEVLIHMLNNHNISSDKMLATINLLELNILIEHTAKRYTLKFENIF